MKVEVPRPNDVIIEKVYSHTLHLEFYFCSMQGLGRNVRRSVKKCCGSIKGRGATRIVMKV
jgi:hypothetical protein